VTQHLEQEFAVAHQAFYDGLYAEARSLFKHLKAGYSREQVVPPVTYYLDYSYLLIAEGELDEAMVFLEEAVRHYPEHQGLLARWKINGDLMLEMGQPDCIVGTMPVTQDQFSFLWISPCSPDELGGGQHPPQIAKEIAKLGYRLAYCQVSAGVKMDLPYDLIQDPFFLQSAKPTAFQTERYQSMLRPWIESPAKNKVAVFMIFSPYLLSWVPYLRAHGVKIVYWCLDRWEKLNWPLVPMETEIVLTQEADGLLATAKPLQKFIQTHSSKPCEIIPNGFPLESFSNLRDAQPPDWQKGKDLTFIYWGNLANNWLNWEWLAHIAKQHPAWQFNLIGNVRDSVKSQMRAANIAFLGEKENEALMPYGRLADFGFIHFVENELTEAVNPVKVYEYLACGLPVISTPMSELNGMPGVFQAKGLVEVEAAVQQILTMTAEEKRLLDDARQTFLATATWESRARDFIQCCELWCHA
jgi:glycosyltransferase involved in cell wall biosynthesis